MQMPERETGLQGEFSASTRQEKRAVYETVKENVRQEAQKKREEIPPQYRQEPYEPEAPEESRMSGAFNRSADVGDNASKMKSEVKRDKPPEAEI